MMSHTSSVDDVILSEAKNLSPGMHAGRSAIPTPIRRALDAPNEIHPKDAPQNDDPLGV